MKKLFHSSIEIIVAAVLLAGCQFNPNGIEINPNGIKGSGNVTSENRAVEPFEQLAINGVFDIALTQGDTENVTMEIDDNLQEYIVVENENNTLTISIKDDAQLKATKNNLHIQVKNIDKLSIAGVFKVTTQTALHCDNLKIDIDGVSSGNLEIYGQRVEADLDGVGNISLRGAAAELVIDKDGVGSVNAKEMKAVVVRLNNASIGGAKVYASGEFWLKNAGIGSVTYSGDGVVKSVQAEGVGKIKKD